MFLIFFHIHTPSSSSHSSLVCYSHNKHFDRPNGLVLTVFLHLPNYVHTWAQTLFGDLGVLDIYIRLIWIYLKESSVAFSTTFHIYVDSVDGKHCFGAICRDYLVWKPGNCFVDPYVLQILNYHNIMYYNIFLILRKNNLCPKGNYDTG